MAQLLVKYDEVRSEVIAPLKGDAQDLNEAVYIIQNFMNSNFDTSNSGLASEALSDVIEHINEEAITLAMGLDNYAELLERVCEEFEKLDTIMNSQLSN